MRNSLRDEVRSDSCSVPRRESARDILNEQLPQTTSGRIN